MPPFAASQLSPTLQAHSLLVAQAAIHSAFCPAPLLHFCLLPHSAAPSCPLSLSLLLTSLFPLLLSGCRCLLLAANHPAATVPVSTFLGLQLPHSLLQTSLLRLHAPCHGRALTSARCSCKLPPADANRLLSPSVCLPASPCLLACRLCRLAVSKAQWLPRSGIPAHSTCCGCCAPALGACRDCGAPAHSTCCGCGAPDAYGFHANWCVALVPHCCRCTRVRA